MVQNKKLGAGLALVAGLMGLAVSGTASALPEVVVGSHIASVAVQPQVEADDSAQVTDDAAGDAVATDDDADGSAN